MNNKDRGSQEGARRYAFLLLKFRLRSEKELYERLKKKKFNEEAIKKTVSFLKDKGFINDNDFARTWIAWRIKKPLGLKRLRQELRIKGIDKEIIDNEIQKVKEDYSEEDIVSKIAQEKFNKFKNLEPQKAKGRIYAYLLRRGFASPVVIDAINQL